MWVVGQGVESEVRSNSVAIVVWGKSSGPDRLIILKHYLIETYVARFNLDAIRGPAIITTTGKIGNSGKT
ncbi:hypothetical protein Psta_1096 [Pirellula staleyi DSM 6068]|uniref:Uncharacterized protein n=1 Tax=Pirellula staleyi (strain ATCC 27377 / DSM 6068 / ICPB 4128) TaxID=530564 RepID=D2R8G2_PIRSD|nr:hypothetical protein Psta_1096 [Pirellula staleyi DSM 6068]